MTLRIVVPAYNCSEWIERCLVSIREQSMPDYAVTVIDDASTDRGSAFFIQDYCREHGWGYRLNAENMGAGYNIHRAITQDLCFDAFDDPVLLIDGDDFLPHTEVFSRVAEIYEDPDVWFMWAQYEPRPYHTTLDSYRHPVQVDPTTTNRTQIPSCAYTSQVVNERAYRKVMNACNHLITFRYFLYEQSIEPADLQDDDGAWLKAGYDRMMFVPMLERADTHHRFVDEVMYCYNSINPLSDVSVRPQYCDLAHELVARRPVKPVLDPTWVAEQRKLHAAGL